MASRAFGLCKLPFAGQSLLCADARGVKWGRRYCSNYVQCHQNISECNRNSGHVLLSHLCMIIQFPAPLPSHSAPIRLPAYRIQVLFRLTARRALQSGSASDRGGLRIGLRPSLSALAAGFDSPIFGLAIILLFPRGFRFGPHVFFTFDC